MIASIKNGKLIIELPINETPSVSKSGKTLVVATSHGIVPTTVTVDGKPVRIGVNAIIAA